MRDRREPFCKPLLLLEICDSLYTQGTGALRTNDSLSRAGAMGRLLAGLQKTGVGFPAPDQATQL